MFKRKKKSYVSLELKDYVLRAIVAEGLDPSRWRHYELPLAHGIVENGIIHDEVALFESMNHEVAKWAGKKQLARMFVPDMSVLLKSFDVPHDLKPEELRGYAEMEIGHSIHLPFQEPLIDVYDADPLDGKAQLYAAPSEEVNKIVAMLLDIALEPEVADIRALCNIRLLHHLQILEMDKTYLIAEWSINELSISIFSQGNVEFLRYQSIDTNMEQWESKIQGEYSYNFQFNGELEDYRMIVMDQVLEIDRMMNFFRFSLHKGEKSVDEIIILGDNPLLPTISEFLRANLGVPLTELNDQMLQKKFPQFTRAFSSLLGLALKEVHG